MRRTLSAVFITAALLQGTAGTAQTHKVAKPEQVLRAVGVYEWTGDLKKPTASRLIPVTVFINGALEDAGVYLARPIPFALTPGNEYELQQAGVPRGELDLEYARHLQSADTTAAATPLDDGWFGYGSFKAPPPPKKEPVLRASKSQPVLTSSRDDFRPHLSNKSDNAATDKPDPAPAGKDPQTSSSDPADQSAKKSSGTSSVDDPDRPTMRRRSQTSAPAADSPAPTGAGSTPSEDPDRPTLRRRSPEDAKKSKQSDNDVASVTSTGSLNNDPDRPRLQRGARSTASDTEMPRLVGIPKDLHQMVAVSDPATRPPHDFTRAWQDENEHTSVLAKMRQLARAQLLAYAADPLASQDANTSPQSPAPSGSAQRRPTRPARPGSRSPAKSTPAPETPLLDEDLKAYTLSYGGAPTYIYSAHTAGTGADLRYVTVVAQADVNGDLRPAVRNATDEAHLHRNPRLHLVDVVDVEASNRASLLFELRGQSSRQFAVYRVLGSRAQALFTTGTTQ